MSDAKLWIDEVGFTATITGTNVSYTMPLWVFDVMRDIIVIEAEKKVEVTHRDFDIQQELLDRYKAENAKLRELAWTLASCAAGYGCDYCPLNGGCGHVEENDMCETVHERMRELEVTLGMGGRGDG